MTLPRALLVLAVAIAAATVAALVAREPTPPAAVEANRPQPRAPAPVPVDAASITGRLPMEHLPTEVGAALEAHEALLEKNAALLEQKQQRITGTCAPGSAIRVIAADGSVSCQRLPKGVTSVSALAGIPLLPTTVTSAASVAGGIGRFQTAGEDDYLVVPLALPDGAVITSFSFVFVDNSEAIDGAAYLYRSDDQPMAAVATSGNRPDVRAGVTEQIQYRKVDAANYAYFVYFQTSTAAGVSLLPISASVGYRLP